MASPQIIGVLPVGPPGKGPLRLTKPQPRYIRPYPEKTTTGLVRTRKDIVRRRLYRIPRPRRHARSRFQPHMDEMSALEARASKSYRGSLEERIFYQALVDHKLMPGIDFDAQPSFLGGRAELGGLVADFIFPEPMVIVQVQSVWHTMSMEIVQRDSDQAAILKKMGYTVLEIWPDTIYSQAALDWWIERNIHYLWGTSQQLLGTGAASGINYVNAMLNDYSAQWYISHMTQLVTEMLTVFEGKPATPVIDKPAPAPWTPPYMGPPAPRRPE